jgi:hypothetical protein
MSGSNFFLTPRRSQNITNQERKKGERKEMIGKERRGEERLLTTERERERERESIQLT